MADKVVARQVDGEDTETEAGNKLIFSFDAVDHMEVRYEPLKKEGDETKDAAVLLIRFRGGSFHRVVMESAIYQILEDYKSWLERRR